MSEDRPASTLVAAQLHHKTIANWLEPLRDWDIQLLVGPDTNWGNCHACLVDTTECSLPEAVGILAGFVRWNVPIIAVTDGAIFGSRTLLEAGAAALLMSTAGAQEVAFSVWSVVQQAATRGSLVARVSALEQQVNRSNRIAQAIAIIAKHTGIPESSALRDLRAEARRQRRSMEELAQSIIDASSLFPRQ